MNARFKDRSFATLRYMIMPLAIIDLVVIIPFYLSFMFVLDLRLLRVLKLAHSIIPKWRHFRDINKDRTARQITYSILNEDAYSGEFHGVIGTALVGMICLSVLSVILESVADIELAFAHLFHYFDMFSVGFFTIEYVLRIYASPEEHPEETSFATRLKLMMSMSGIIDLLAILPFYLSFIISFDLRFLRVMRLLRIFKLTRYSSAMSTVTEVIEEELPSLSAAFFVLMLITVLSASLLYRFEHEAQPDKFTSIPAAMYWAVITLTTISYAIFIQLHQLVNY